MLFYVVVQDRQSGESVEVGSMLTLAECRELIACLSRFNASDFLILKYKENLK